MVYSGGCLPQDSRTALRLTRPGRFNFKRLMVALPVGESPIIIVKLLSHRKWSSHLSSLGWNNVAKTPVTISNPSVAVYLCKLQPKQDHAKFSEISLPPLLIGIICSAENGSWEYFSCARQYSQHPCARDWMVLLSSLVILYQCFKLNSANNVSKSTVRSFESNFK